MTQAREIGIQLYTLRDALDEDYRGTLEALRELGIRNLEFAGNYGGLDAQGLRALLDELGFSARSAHLPLEPLEQDPQGQSDFLHALGSQHAVFPYFKADDQASWTDLAQRLERTARSLSEYGITLSYHNHDHELSQTFDGQPVLDLLMEQAPSLKLELDVAWVYAGGQDPVAYLNKYADRIPLVHIKDVKKSAEGWQTVELGAGEVDLTSALTAVPDQALLFYEQDFSNGLPSVKQSFDYLNALPKR